MYELAEKIKSWIPADKIDTNTYRQIEVLSRLEFVKPWVAVMPDAHLGKGACVGSVIATQGAIIPAAVGVDIGCGMTATRTTLRKRDIEGKLQDLRKGISNRVPLGIGQQNQEVTVSAQKATEYLVDYMKTNLKGDVGHLDTIFSAWPQQIGTLGAGNHFVELSVDEDEIVWVVLHSGSRLIGNLLAKSHINIAKAQMKLYHIKLEDPDLAYLSEGTKEFDNYLRDLRWAQEYARVNREEMMLRVMTEITSRYTGQADPETIAEQVIDCHHNFSAQEYHMGRNYWITRKGAIRMRVGDLGIIPGSMGTATYIVEGKANASSFASAPHGAGRIFSRSEAKQQFTLEDMDREMAGIEYERSVDFLDELPSAYKPIDEIMDYAKDLVTIKHKLRQLINIKGI